MAHEPVVFISPHLDDVVLSCGGIIHSLKNYGGPIYVITIFAGSPVNGLSSFAKWLHNAWNLPSDTPIYRREEDYKAISFLAAKSVHLPFQDSIYRLNPSTQQFLYTTKSNIFSGDWSKEPALLSEIISELKKQFIKQDYELIFVPLGIGQHIDHILTRKAVESIFTKLKRDKLIFYEDFPYALKFHPFDDQIFESSKNPTHSRVYSLTEEDIQAKEYAIQLYKSQSQEVAGEIGVQIVQVRQYASLVIGKDKEEYGERYWASGTAPLNKLSELQKI